MKIRSFVISRGIWAVYVAAGQPPPPPVPPFPAQTILNMFKASCLFSTFRSMQQTDHLRNRVRQPYSGEETDSPQAKRQTAQLRQIETESSAKAKNQTAQLRHRGSPIQLRLDTDNSP